MIKFNVMDQFVSVWMKREKKFQEREFIGIKPSTARENCHSQLVTILDSFPNSDQYTISPHKFPYITQLTGEGKIGNVQLEKTLLLNFLRTNVEVVCPQTLYFVLSSS